MTHGESPSVDPSPITTTLIVEDDQELAQMLGRFLQTLGHEAIIAPDGEEALALLKRRRLTCVLLDVGLPTISGAELVPQILEIEPHAAVVMMTAVNDAHIATSCLQQGAMDYLVKPVDLPDLERAIGRALARRSEEIEREETQAWLKQEIVRRGAELRKERGNLERISIATLEALVNALEAKDPYLRGHSARIATLSAQVSQELGLGEDQVEAVRTAGRLHDIGKIGIRESVLNKQGSLTEAEYDHVKTHVTIGADILAPLTHLRTVISYVRSHHERVDGTGYPDQLSGEAIPIGAKVICAAEVYDALTTSRPYQERMSAKEAVERMANLVDTVLDRQVLEALHVVVSRGEELVFIEGTER